MVLCLRGLNVGANGPPRISDFAAKRISQVSYKHDESIHTLSARDISGDPDPSQPIVT